MAAPTGLLRLIPGASRVTGTRYQRAPVTGDFWIEIVDAQCRLGNEFALASDPTLSGRQSDLTAIPADSPKVPAALVAAGVTPAAPVNLNPPSISGIAQVGQVLTRVNGTWANSPTSYAHQWYANGVAISGATGATYTPVTADIGKIITVSTVATNAIGSSPLATSAATSAVIAASAALAISGTPGAAKVGTAYTFAPTVTGGSGTKTFSLSGTLPAGLSFSASTGAISGTPTTAGTTSGLAIAVTDTSGSATLSALSITVGAASAGGSTADSTGGTADSTGMTADGSASGGTTPAAKNILTESGAILTTEDGRTITKE